MASFEETRRRVEKARETDFARLRGAVYLDHAGAAQYPRRLVDRYASDLTEHMYSNPHSGSLSGQRVQDLIHNVRCMVLQHFNTTPDEYHVIFTSGCTAGLKLLAESFDFGAESALSVREKDRDGREGYNGGFCYLIDNHTSVMGMREVARDRGAGEWSFTEETLLTCLKEGSSEGITSSTTKGNLLFAFPAQSNFCGRRYPLDWIQAIRNLSNESGRNYTLLDAAGFVTTSKLDLSLYKPDYISISFYKMFGFPTGLGALLVRNGCGDNLKKTYFGGGTVKVALPAENFHAPRDSLSERFEDGTINYLDVLALRHAFDTFNEITEGIENVSQYTFLITKSLYLYLRDCRHGNGNPVAMVYSDTDFECPSSQGPIVTFNLLRSSGDHVGFSEVSKFAELYNVHLRTGCFCNLGDCQRHLDMSSEHVKENFQQGHVCGDDVDLVDGCPTGAVRVSLGYSTTPQNVCSFVCFIEDCFVEGRQGMDAEAAKDYLEKTLSGLNTGALWVDKKDASSPVKSQIPKGKDDFQGLPSVNALPLVANERGCPDASGVYVSQICVYPVKSCGAFTTAYWEIGPRGFVYDREWMVVDSAGISLTQKKCPSLVLIQPHIDLQKGLLTLSYPGLTSVSVPLRQSTSAGEGVMSHLTCMTPVCRDTVQGHVCEGQVSEWLTDALGLPGLRLVRQDQKKTRTTKRTPLVGEPGSSISLANESQYLLISEESVNKFHASMIEQTGNNNLVPSEVPDVTNILARFRANIIVAGNIGPYEEETWKSLRVGNCHGNIFNVQGRCKRCQVICMDQKTGSKQKEVFRTLSAITERKATFGILINNDINSEVTSISLGDSIEVLDTI